MLDFAGSLVKNDSWYLVAVVTFETYLRQVDGVLNLTGTLSAESLAAERVLQRCC